MPRTLVDENNISPNTFTNTMEEVFGRFEEMYKQFQEGFSYDEFSSVKVLFDTNMVRLDDVTDIEIIIDEINKVSGRIFMYGALYESQQRVLHQLEDEYEIWFAEKYVIVDSNPEPAEDTTEVGKKIKKKKQRTETQKEQLIIVAYGDEYSAFKERIRNETRRLGLVKRVVNSLDSYSYKLHSILNYRQIALQKGL